MTLPLDKIFPEFKDRMFRLAYSITWNPADAVDDARCTACRSSIACRCSWLSWSGIR